jgi:response regulator of citrate/malate metabolism
MPPTRREVNEEFARKAKERGFNPVYLKEIIHYRNLGYNNTEIADATGISRSTVNDYVSRLKEHEDDTGLVELILLGLALYVGVKIAEDLFG